MQRHQCGLDAEHQQQQQCCGLQQTLIGCPHLRHLQREIGHVQRAGDAVDQRGADQEQRRGGQVGDHVMRAGLQPLAAAAMHHQPVGGDQQHLIEHEQVEQVAGQEGAVHPHQLELEQRVEMLAALVPAADGIEQHEQRQHGSQQQHHRRQPVQHHDDAEGRRPVAQQIGFRRGLCRCRNQRNGDGELRGGRGQRDGALQRLFPVQAQQQQAGGDGRHHHRHDDPVVHCPVPFRLALLPSTWSPSTWSLSTSR